MLSAMYILMALGFTLILAVLNIFNFSHGAIYTVGAYICYQLAIVLGINKWLALLISTGIMGLFGLILERLCFRPLLYNEERVIAINIAIIVILQALINVTVGSYEKTLKPFLSGVFIFANAHISVERFATFIIGGCLLLIVFIFIKRSRIGLQLRAVAQDREAGALQGIRINRIAYVTTAVGCALAAASGCLMGAILNLSPFMGDYMLVKAIEIVVLAGIGSIGGVIIGGLILGTIDSVLPLIATGSMTELIGLAVIISILLLRPQGFLGHGS
jgi:branched-chain amino acid transport system permease protein